MKQLKKLQTGQAGFTLLELLVVITLIAALAVGALIAYDGVGDKAQAAAAADANVKIDNAIRQYKAVTNVYPNQWDNLVAEDTSLIEALPTQLLSVVSRWSLGAAASDVTLSLGRAGINELQNWQVWTKSSNAAGVIPNLAHNESFNSINAVESEHFENDGVGDDGPILNIAVVPGLGGTVGTCQASGVTIPATTVDPDGAGPLDAGDNYIQNRYSDALEGDECHLVVALGFGSDAAASTTGKSVSIGKAPSFSKTDTANPDNNIDPNQHYSRYIGLFLVGSDTSEDGNITGSEYLAKARLLTIIAPDGTIADQNLATAVQN
ncbi:type II secretion system protein [Methylomonas rapida]|uniref:Type II secretion system protein n=1 Tax=Methylomonas rapida TaxID=2963939 RepID=A0ABY7GL13_9GAMM|nr:type II secretion system protein [Methylomonas rapida]WAR45186.1 type II secretion system protein [Methylomonas rapida]